MPDPRRKRRWRLLRVGPRNGAENMARDIALMRRARDSGETVFSIYEWATPTLSFGRNQTALGLYNREALADRRVNVVRRPTGGRALLHHREVTYSVTAPVDQSETLQTSYERINRILLDGLTRLSVGATIANPSSTAKPPTDLPCFAEPSKGELVSNGRKLVGSAQWRDSGALLQHGSILIEDDQPMIRLFSVFPENEEIPGAATLSEALGRTPDVDEVADAMFDSVRSREDPDALTLDEGEIKAATREQVGYFENELWTWRR
ncbi:MAG TPA: lipoate--protein ligase family protein [Gemmatimonadaceae bacterium]|nr:lipoate--protein ligase family protein [Gemmatimonadaceae bacterium]